MDTQRRKRVVWVALVVVFVSCAGVIVLETLTILTLHGKLRQMQDVHMALSIAFDEARDKYYECRAAQQQPTT